jgi:carbon storage regulator
MLVLTRKATEEIQIGGSIKVTVLATSGNKVKLGITCPTGISILRAELSRRDAGGRRERSWPSSPRVCRSESPRACLLTAEM